MVSLVLEKPSPLQFIDFNPEGFFCLLINSNRQELVITMLDNSKVLILNPSFLSGKEFLIKNNLSTKGVCYKISTFEHFRLWSKVNNITHIAGSDIFGEVIWVYNVN